MEKPFKILLEKEKILVTSNNITSVHVHVCVHASFQTTAVAWWLECLPREPEVVGLTPSRDSAKSLKLFVLAFPLGAQDYRNSTTTLRLASHCQDNGLVKFGLKIVQEIWICELSPFNN